MKTWKIKNSKVRALVICIEGLMLLALSGYMLIFQLKDYREAEALYENLAEELVIPQSAPQNAKEIAEAIKEDVAGDINWKDLIVVDISKMRKVNPDIIGWIYFENVDISYPVLYSADDSTYLRKTYSGENLSSGSIFMEGQNSSDFSDAHTIIYGHNMKNLSMFGKLKYYVTNDDYINGHEYFQIITENEKYRYKVIAYKIVPDDSEIYTIYKSGGQDFWTFAKNVIQSGSYLDSGENIKYDDYLITLSTCYNDDRLVVTAVREQ